MGGKRNHRRFRLRDLIATAALCVFILRALGGLAMTASPPAAIQGGATHLSSLLRQPDCENHAGRSNPGKQQKGHDSCCATCMSSAREHADFDARVATEIIVFAPRQDAVPIAPATRSPAPIKPPGLAANWSATSPPQG